jgi:hypothetical protein
MPVAPRLTIIAAAITALALPTGASAKKAKDPSKLPAQWQHRFGVSSAKTDPDGDGLTNLTEFRAKTNPKRLDTDRDGIDDDAEDRDRDGLDNASEQRAGTDVAKRDSDRDGRPDAREDADRDGLPNGAEQATANDPADRDSDDDGIKDGKENAGQVVALTDGVLTLRLAATGKLVTAPVADDADVACDATDDYEADFEDDVSEDAGDDHSDGDGVEDEDADAADDEDEVVAAAAVIRGEDDGYSADEDEGELEDDLGEDELEFDDACADTVLAAGAWVHEAELDHRDAGLKFTTVELVEGA